MCCGNNGWGGNSCLWIILLIIILCCCCGNSWGAVDAEEILSGPAEGAGKTPLPLRFRGRSGGSR